MIGIVRLDTVRRPVPSTPRRTGPPLSHERLKERITQIASMTSHELRPTRAPLFAFLTVMCDYTELLAGTDRQDKTDFILSIEERREEVENGEITTVSKLRAQFARWLDAAHPLMIDVAKKTLETSQRFGLRVPLEAMRGFNKLSKDELKKVDLHSRTGEDLLATALQALDNLSPAIKKDDGEREDDRSIRQLVADLRAEAIPG